jgi:large subunit ribosomal protein L29
MKASLLIKKTNQELKEEMISKEKELNELKFDAKTGKEKNVSRISKIRKDIARILTIINQTKAMTFKDESDKIDDIKNKV